MTTLTEKEKLEILYRNIFAKKEITEYDIENAKLIIKEIEKL